MKKIYLALLPLLVIVWWCWFQNNEKIVITNTEPAPSVLIAEITQVHTGRVTEQNGYFLINPTTYWFKYGNYFHLIWQINNPTISFSGNQLAQIKDWYVNFEKIKILYPEDAKWWYYTDKSLHGYTLLPENRRWTWKSLSLSSDYFVSGNSYVWDKSLLDIRAIPWKEEDICIDNNDDDWPGAWIADVYFSQTINQFSGINVYTTYRWYSEGDSNLKTTRDSLCFIYKDNLYDIQIYNYPRSETDMLFHSLQLL